MSLSKHPVEPRSTIDAGHGYFCGGAHGQILGTWEEECQGEYSQRAPLPNLYETHPLTPIDR